MNAESPKFTISRVAALSLVSLWLAGCMSSSNLPAPVSSVDKDVNTGMMITSSPKINTVASQQIPVGQPVQRLITQPTQIRPVEQPVHMQNNCIVYNRQYMNILKGSYAGGSTYTVKPGDTLFYIAWITGNDFHNLAQRNNIHSPYGLEVGQTLQVGNAIDKPLLSPGNIVSATAVSAQKNNMMNTQKSTTVVASQPVITYSEPLGKQIANKLLPNSKSVVDVVTVPVATVVSSTKSISSSSSNSSPLFIWRWPTDGKIIEHFSSYERGNKGIDIAGSKGQAIAATADGRVVYAGNALRGYGNLIIIKHNDDYLSAYAHNDKMLVKEQEEVKAEQKIATMGSTGTNSTRLHFEIRYKGKSVNPLQYLPQR